MVTRRGVNGALAAAAAVALLPGQASSQQWPWARIDCDLDQVTLHEAYVALGSPEVFAIGHRREEPTCLVEQAVTAALADAFRDAEALLLSHLPTRHRRRGWRRTADGGGTRRGRARSYPR